MAWLVAVLGDRTVRGMTRVLLGNPDQRRFKTALRVSIETAIPLVIERISASSREGMPGGSGEGMPDSSRDQLERALSERFSAPPVLVLDGRTPVRTALINAVRQQIAPLAEPAVVLGGRSFLDEIGVDAEQLRTDLAEVAIQCIKDTALSFSALRPLVSQLNSDGTVELEEAIAAKLDMILAGLEQWRQVPVPVYQFPRDTLVRITNGLLAIPAVSDNDTRNAILNMLPESLRHSISRSPVPRVQVYSLVLTCSVHEHGMRDLIETIRLLDGGTLPMRDLDNLILELGVAVEAEPHGERANS